MKESGVLESMAQSTSEATQHIRDDVVFCSMPVAPHASH